MNADRRAPRSRRSQVGRRSAGTRSRGCPPPPRPRRTRADRGRGTRCTALRVRRTAGCRPPRTRWPRAPPRGWPAGPRRRPCRVASFATSTRLRPDVSASTGSPVGHEHQRLHDLRRPRIRSPARRRRRSSSPPGTAAPQDAARARGPPSLNRSIAELIATTPARQVDGELTRLRELQRTPRVAERGLLAHPVDERPDRDARGRDLRATAQHRHRHRVERPSSITPAGTFPKSDWASSDPSPVITSAAPSIRPPRSTASITTSTPRRRRAPQKAWQPEARARQRRRRQARPSDAIPRSRCTTAARWASARSSRNTSSAEAPFWGP